MEEKKPYKKPVVIYSDVLKTRAGSPLGGEEDTRASDTAEAIGDLTGNTGTANEESPGAAAIGKLTGK